MELMIKRGARYTGIGLATFGIDLLLLFLFIDYFGLNVLFATGLAFLIALSINYFLSRRFVFKYSARDLKEGYVYFLIVALIGMGFTVALMWGLMTYTALSVLISRILVAFFVGLGNYFVNLLYNFKVAGVSLEGEIREKERAAHS